MGASLLLLSGCAAPGIPVTRQSAVPQAVTDLSAKQVGDSIVLSFTLPTRTVQGKTLSKPPAIEIYRGFWISPATAINAGSGQLPLVTTIPSQMIGRYQTGEHVEFPDILTLADLTADKNAEALYLVRARLGKHTSNDSNTARVFVLPAPQPIEDLHAQVTKTSVQLSWTMPAVLPTSAPPPISVRYRIYRADTSIGGNRSTATNSSQFSKHAEPVLLGESLAPSYDDPNFIFGHTYAYSVRSVATYQYGSVESAESNLLEVTPQDVFAPATPENLAATATAANSIAVHVDLSWAISTENDLLGYNVYRSESIDTPGARVNATLLITPVFQDNSVVPGRQYFYRVTAVDRTGNESAPSSPIQVTVPGPKEQQNR